jgi:4-hydroxy-tetrahydrodipicolinate reductase
VRVLQYGLGMIGVACARAVLETKGLALEGAVDVDPMKAGRPLRAILGPSGSAASPRLRVAATLHEALAAGRVDVVLHTTQSSFARIFPQVKECLEAGLSVVSSTEELALPFATGPALARKLDAIARRKKVALLGTGVNPGFVMDVLPIVAAAASRDVRSLRIERVLDAGARRASFQRKVGVGLAPAEAERRLRAGGFGHIGLLESALLVASACDLHIDRIREESHPILARRTLDSAFGAVRRGQVAGLHQSVSGLRKGVEILRLDVVMALGVTDPHDAATIEADPPVRLRLEGGLPGDTATIAALLNAIPRVLAAPPGLHTALDLPIPRPSARSRR